MCERRADHAQSRQETGWSAHPIECTPAAAQLEPAAASRRVLHTDCHTLQINASHGNMCDSQCFSAEARLAWREVRGMHSARNAARCEKRHIAVLARAAKVIHTRALVALAAQLQCTVTCANVKAHTSNRSPLFAAHGAFASLAAFDGFKHTRNSPSCMHDYRALNIMGAKPNIVGRHSPRTRQHN